MDDRAKQVARLADKHLVEMQDANNRRTDRLFAKLLAGQLGLAVLLAFVGPEQDRGRVRVGHAPRQAC